MTAKEEPLTSVVTVCLCDGSRVRDVLMLRRFTDLRQIPLNGRSQAKLRPTKVTAAVKAFVESYTNVKKVRSDGTYIVTFTGEAPGGSIRHDGNAFSRCHINGKQRV